MKKWKATLLGIAAVACLGATAIKSEAAEAETSAIAREPSVWGIAYTEDDANMTGYFVAGGKWKHNQTGWWYQFKDGTYVKDAYVIVYDSFGDICPRDSWKGMGTPDISAYLDEMSGRLETRTDIYGWQTIPVGGVYTESYMTTEGGIAQVHETDEILNMKVYHFDKNGYMSQSEYIAQGMYNYLYVDANGLVQTGTLDEPDQKITYRWWAPSRPTSNWFGETWRAGKNDYSGSWYARNEWLKIDGKWCYFDDNGYQVYSGWHAIDGAWYYFKDGQYQTGWIKLGSKHYYCNASGKMVTGWKKINGEWYFFKPDGSMTTGWRKIKGEWYYFDIVGGQTMTGWIKSGDAWYYCLEGKMLTGEQVIGGTTYVLDTDGKLLKIK